MVRRRNAPSRTMRPQFRPRPSFETPAEFIIGPRYARTRWRLLRMKAKCAGTDCMAPSCRADASPLHRRSHTVAADIDAGGFQPAVFLFSRTEDDEFGAGLDLRFVAGDEGDDRRLRRHHDFLLAVLVLDDDVLAVGAFH